MYVAKEMEVYRRVGEQGLCFLGVPAEAKAILTCGTGRIFGKLSGWRPERSKSHGCLSAGRLF